MAFCRAWKRSAHENADGFLACITSKMINVLISSTHNIETYFFNLFYVSARAAGDHFSARAASDHFLRKGTLQQHNKSTTFFSSALRRLFSDRQTKINELKNDPNAFPDQRGQTSVHFLLFPNWFSWCVISEGAIPL